MKEIRDIIQAYDAATAAGKKSALATVVHVEGSSYRKPGARMLIIEDGRLTGAISGGCLEGDALRKALRAMAERRSTLVTYDTMDEDDATLGIGLGCNGIIQILIEPLPADAPLTPLDLLKMVNARREPSVLVTLFSLKNRQKPQPGACLLFRPGGSRAGSLPASEGLEARIRAAGEQVFQNKKSAWLTCAEEDDAALTAFVEYIPPALRLVVVGAGNDVMPLVEMADLLGWEATVVDGRPTHARPERFAKACEVLVAKPEQVLGKIDLDEYTAFALMTHNYNYDKAMLLELCRKNARHIAMLGPKKKLQRMLEAFENEGVTLSSENLSAIHSPAGLDLGAENAEEIALSIVAEIKAVLAGRMGRSLRLGSGEAAATEKR